ncbi:MAG: hypothetical protein KDK54_22765, partial [Leptospiraceae bacterium]|nr:hypothetical protein [Leptospiraceae bacterium]
NVFAVRVKNFCSQNVLDHAVKRLTSLGKEDYINAEGVGKIKGIGSAYFEATDAASRSEYHQTAVDSIEKVREVFSPYLSPVDQVRLSLDEQWNKGASLLRTDEGPHFVGLTRAITTSILPHEDKLERDNPELVKKVNYVGQFAFNTYLTNAPGQGEIRLWDQTLPDEVYDEMRRDSYGIDPSLLPPPSCVIVPTPGDLILFNARKLHAVGHSSELRLSSSGFILYGGEKNPLHIWS